MVRSIYIEKRTCLRWSVVIHRHCERVSKDPYFATASAVGVAAFIRRSGVAKLGSKSSIVDKEYFH